MNGRNIICMAAALVMAFLVCGNATEGEEGTCLGAWSSTVNGLKGRCVLSTSTIGERSDLVVFLELSNEGKDNLTLDLGNPFWESANLLGPDKRPVPPMSEVPGLLMSTNTALLPRGCYFGFPVSKRHLGGAGQIAVGLFAWNNLNPGKYTLCMKYAVVPKDENKAKRLAALQKGEWRGTLVIPSVEIEVTPK